jgi:hypothetical protein
MSEFGHYQEKISRNKLLGCLSSWLGVNTRMLKKTTSFGVNKVALSG